MRVDPAELFQVYRALAGSDVARCVARTAPHFACNAAFADGRIDEGSELARHFQREYGDRAIRVIDVGAGNGGVAFGIANQEQYTVVAVDVVINHSVSELRTATGIPVHQVIARADALPFRTGVTDVVLSLETLEHLPDAPSAGREMMRILRPLGQVMITTPPRLRYLLRPDPHYSIRSLLLFPDKWQRFVAERCLRRTANYDVIHTFWTARGILRLFPGRAHTEILINVPWPPPPRSWRDHVQLFRHHFWKRLRHVLWDRIVIYKR